MIYTFVYYKQVNAILKISCLKKGTNQQNNFFFNVDMYPAVSHESWNTYGTGLVNSFGTVVMAAFAAAVKIDAFAYMPVQDFGNAFSTFIAQNKGAHQEERIQKGLKSAICISTIFCLMISFGVVVFAKELMLIFIHPEEVE